MISLTKAHIREIFTIAVPAAAEKLLLLFTGIVSMIIVGRINSDTLVAVSMCNTIYNVLQALFLGLSLGATIRIAREYGNGDRAAAESTMYHMILINIVTGVGLLLMMLFGGEAIVRLLFGTLDDEVIRLTLLFIKITLFSLPLMGIDCAISAALRGAGNARLPLILTLVVNMINIVIGYVTVYWCHMGVVGVALAFLISRSFGGIIRLIFVLSGTRKTEIKLHLRERFQTAQIKRIFSCGGITMLEQLMLQMGFLGMQVITAGISKEAIGAYQVANSVINLVYALTFGFETAAVTVVGRYLGQKRADEARLAGNNVLCLTEVLTCFLGVWIYIFAAQFLAIFTDDAKMIANGIEILRWLVLTVPITSCYQGISGTLKTGGRALTLLILNIIGPWMIRIPVAYYLCVTLGMGIPGLMLGLFADYTVRAICYSVAFFRWKHTLKARSEALSR